MSDRHGHRQQGDRRGSPQSCGRLPRAATFHAFQCLLASRRCYASFHSPIAPRTARCTDTPPAPTPALTQRGHAQQLNADRKFIELDAATVRVDAANAANAAASATLTALTKRKRENEKSVNKRAAKLAKGALAAIEESAGSNATQDTLVVPGASPASKQP